MKGERRENYAEASSERQKWTGSAICMCCYLALLICCLRYQHWKCWKY